MTPGCFDFFGPARFSSCSAPCFPKNEIYKDLNLPVCFLSSLQLNVVFNMPVPFKTSEDQNKHRDPMREVFTTLSKSHTWYLDTFLRERSHPVFPRIHSGVPFDDALKAVSLFSL